MNESSSPRPHQLTQLHLPADLGAWQAAGFAGDDQIRLGRTSLIPRVTTAELSGSLDGIEELDGLALVPRDQTMTDADTSSDAADHPNTAVAIDHVVVLTPDCDRTTTRFEQAGLHARRVRRIESRSGTRRQTFFWMGDVVCELVGPDEADGDGPAAWWGMALTVQNLGAARELLGDNASDIKDAVQPGRQVSTVRSSAQLVVPTLLISPHVDGISSHSTDG